MIIGHQKQWELLKKMAELGRSPHAFLFFGPSQIGKKTLALEFVKLLNCQAESRNLRPCQTCQTCQSIERMTYPDLQIVQPKNQEIQIAQIRALSWYISLYPYQGRFKAAIIDEAHKMSQEAQSAFLKILEEPKGNALFILVTEAPERLLPTIISRCEKLRFCPVSSKEIENYLRERALPPQKIKEITSFSFGKPGLALSFLAEPQRLEMEKRALQDIVLISSAPLHTRFQYASSLISREENLRDILEVWLRYFRKILILRINNKREALNINKEFGHYSLRKLIKIIKLLQQTIFLFSTTNVNSRLALEILFMEI